MPKTRVHINQQTDEDLPRNYTNVTDPGAADLNTAMIDAFNGVVITNTTTSTAMTLGNPTDTEKGKTFVVANNDTSTDDLDVEGQTVKPDNGITFVWDGDQWVVGGGVGGDDRTIEAHTYVNAADYSLDLDEYRGVTITADATIVSGAIRVVPFTNAAEHLGETVLFTVANTGTNDVRLVGLSGFSFVDHEDQAEEMNILPGTTHNYLVTVVNANRGLITDHEIERQIIVNSDGGVYTYQVTLSEFHELGDTLTFVNESVQSNDALFLNAGGSSWSINGSVSNQFKFSDYPDGTQFQVVRSGTNELSITALGVGAGKSTVIDSSAAAVTETLGASGNTGQIKFYVNDDVTNTATLAVQSGETLNGVTDGTFLFSNYAAGTQFRADEVTGGWVVSVVGASTQTSLYVGVFENQINGATAPSNNSIINWGATLDTVYEATADTTPTYNGDGTWTLPEGRWELMAVLTPNSGSSNSRVWWSDTVNNAADDRLGSYGGFARPDSGNGAKHDLPPIAVVGSDGTQLVGVVAATASQGVSNSSTIHFKQLPTTESVLAGMVTPSDLIRGRMELTIGNMSSNSLGTTDYTALTFENGAGTRSSMAFNKVKHTSGGIIADIAGWTDGNASSQIIDGANTAMSFTLPAFTGTKLFDIVVANPEWDSLDTNDRPQVVVAVNGLVKELLTNGNTATSGTDSNGETYKTSLELSGGDLVQMGFVIEGGNAEGWGVGDLTQNLSGTTATDGGDVVIGYFEVEEKPTKTVVLPDTITPTDLNRIQVSLTGTTNDSGATHYGFDETLFTQGSDISLSGTGSIQGLQAGKTYRLSTHLQLDPPSAGDSDATTFRFVDLTGNAQIGEVIDIHPSDAEFDQSSMHSQTSFFTPTVTSEVGIDFVSGTIGELGSRSTFTVEEEPNSTVVNPGDVPVVDNEELLFSTDTASTGTNHNFVSTYTDLAGLQAEFDEIKFVIGGHHNTAGLEEDWYTSIVKAADLKIDDRPIIQFDGSNTIAIDVINATEIGLSFDGVYVNALNKVRVYGIRAQKTVINTTDLATDDQAASGYMDFGTMRMQWGTGTANNIHTFPQPFADTNYGVTTTAYTGGNGQLTHLSAKTTTGFTSIGMDVNAAFQNHSFSYMAIGLKP